MSVLVLLIPSRPRLGSAAVDERPGEYNYVLSPDGLSAGKQGRAATAELLYRRALSILEKILGRDHPDVALTVHNFAVLQLYRGELQEAAGLSQEALERFQRLRTTSR